ncbi:D-alanyl-lipoteichoic acid biosynthesis protein DltD [Mammaliicoccus fleurettii]|uniref:D-alanyl-lipoteichoic acid biosynthesis protein DltD n=1 Tax=Mammaliicoccus fleurettii TaxID=150056 RepID=UPI002DBE0FBC|nr:D-alanyl-lipoteichoic acid biosynthesis protein DltD [Mammaliicoccus fleurettii]MEB6201868.1 D-alanyl-lipoteichoic acid biosynthesis protein DltD [Mammaliicoccus fleurettii]
MKIKLLLPLLLSGILFGLFLLIPVEWLTSLSKQDNINKEAISLNDSVLKGVHSQEEMLLSKHYYPIFGSSELEKQDIFHPAHILKDKNAKLKPYLIGTGGSTDLIHAINVGSQAHNLNGKKVAIIISPQWFTDHGLTNDNFSARFSPLQADHLFKIKSLSPELKDRFAKRLVQFKQLKSDPYLNSVLSKKNHQYDEGTFMNDFENNIHEKHDALKSIFGREKVALTNSSKNHFSHMKWDEMRLYANQYGEKHSTTNNFGMNDQYWNLLKEQRKRYNRNYEFNNQSKEFDDLQLLIDTLKEVNADPLFVVIPANGKWYDHINVNREKREAVYQKINKMLTSNNMKVYDITDKEYEPFVITDAVHIGWKGWVYINEQMINHINGQYDNKVSRQY